MNDNTKAKIEAGDLVRIGNGLLTWTKVLQVRLVDGKTAMVASLPNATPASYGFEALSRLVLVGGLEEATCQAGISDAEAAAANR